MGGRRLFSAVNGPLNGRCLVLAVLAFVCWLICFHSDSSGVTSDCWCFGLAQHVAHVYCLTAAETPAPKTREGRQKDDALRASRAWATRGPDHLVYLVLRQASGLVLDHLAPGRLALGRLALDRLVLGLQALDHHQDFWDNIPGTTTTTTTSRSSAPATTTTTTSSQPTNTTPPPDEDEAEEDPDRSPNPQPQPQPQPEPEPEPEPQPVRGGQDREEEEAEEPPQTTTNQNPDPTAGNPHPSQDQQDEVDNTPPSVTTQTTPATQINPAPAPTETPTTPIFNPVTSEQPWRSGSTATTFATHTSSNTADLLPAVPTAGASDAEGQEQNNSLGTGPIVGIVFGVILGIVFLCLAIFSLVRRRRRKQPAPHEHASTVPPTQQPRSNAEAPPLAWTHVPADNESEKDGVVQIFRWPSLPSGRSGYRRASDEESASLVSTVDRPPHVAMAARTHGHKKSWSRSTISTLIRPSTRGTLARKEAEAAAAAGATTTFTSEAEKRRMSDMVRKHLTAALATNPAEEAGRNNISISSNGREEAERNGGGAYLHPGPLRGRRNSAATMSSVGSSGGGSFVSSGVLSHTLGSFPTPPSGGNSGASTPDSVKIPSPLASQTYVERLETLPAKTYKPYRPGLTGSS
ncbi:hypothetical protein SODALDRAFT_351201 [Sodiomyces alkalinus F11]|uniref:Mid2 domain-containing protein n=1 Tax=Sodiomyces alkalinus (strain CBS 110278 / VKM F-3762 / F11) TaxID=1314773 RepID=A0A3N2PU62_SODAK|nr:hypothetical protein SODALDRAFT_351201 [Sodiomyces alkalinus F11]ROT38040.1 hypothetical protein SODALDRAFT_351201 [Sodiomyces alkalinus F11]